MVSIGDTVTWESQAQGSWTKKTGKVIAVVPPGESALGWVPAEAKKSHVKFEVDIYLKGAGVEDLCCSCQEKARQIAWGNVVRAAIQHAGNTV